MRESWTTFASNTTLHGLRYVVAVSSLLRRLVWVTCILTAAGFYVYLLGKSIRKYIDLPINSRVSYELPNNGTSFPSVSICNLNYFTKSKINAEDGDEQFKRLRLNVTACEITRKVRGNLTCGQALVCASSKFELGLVVIDQCNEAIRNQLLHALNKSSRPLDMEELMFRYGHDFAPMFMDYCRFGETRNCGPEDFKPIVTPYGLCHTFNSDHKGNTSRLKVYRGGYNGGLSVMLDAQTDENLYSEFSLGFSVVVHQQGAYITRERGFLVSPGSHARIIVTPKKFIRLKAPYKTRCGERLLPGLKIYNKDGCFASCFNNVTIKQCACREAGEPVVKGIPVCSMQDNDCRHKADHEGKYNLSSCNCAEPCNGKDFEQRVSYSKFPDIASIKIIRKVSKIYRTTKYFRDNLVFLQVGFSQLEYYVDEQVPAYGAESLFGDVGGNMGLFLGCSLITVVEMIDFICVAVLSKINETKRTSDSPDPGAVDSVDQKEKDKDEWGMGRMNDAWIVLSTNNGSNQTR